MCRTQMTGDVLLALGVGLLIAMLIPRSFWIVFAGIILIVLGCLLGRK